MTSHLIVLGAGSSLGAEPYFGLERATEQRRILGWQLAAYHAIAGHDAPVTFVGGHWVERVSEAYPGPDYLVNPQWQTTGAVASLAIALRHLRVSDAPDHLFILYGDVLVRSELFEMFQREANGAVLIGTDPDLPTAALRTMQGEVLPNPEGTEAEFIGFLSVPKTAFSAFRTACLDLADILRTQHLSALIGRMIESGRGPRYELRDVRGFWGHGENSQAVARFIMGSKATTLARLQKKLTKSKVLPVHSFTYSDWSTGRENILNGIATAFGSDTTLVVRSSAMDEDGFSKANAGKYHSELNVPNRHEGLIRAIEKVFASYKNVQAGDEVLVQPQLGHVVASGVMFTRQLETGAPYYVINYADGTDTTAITGGQTAKHHTVIVARGVDPAAIPELPPVIISLLKAAAEIEQVVLYDALDIEFACLADGTIITLQCRPLVLRSAQSDRQWDDLVSDALQGLQTRVMDKDSPPQVLGDAPVWSIMADWNPAEIVGTRPGVLALDLYRYVITDKTWAVQRRDVGYRDMTAVPLVSNLAGNAYVNVRASLNSFVPACLSAEAATRLINFAQAQLRSEPALHDKIEFEIIPTCVDFTFDRWRTKLMEAQVLSSTDIDLLETGLRAITRNIIDRASGDLSKAQELETEYSALVAQARGRGPEGIRQLLDRCRTEGALTFSHLARAGFVAILTLKSSVAAGILTEARYNALLASVQTVGSLLRQEAFEVQQGRRSPAELVARFGHIRPGTYDISTPSYGTAYEQYLVPIIETATPLSEPNFILSEKEKAGFTRALDTAGLGIDTETFMQFVHDAVAGREFAKFVFTKLVSGALEMIRDELSALGIAAEHYDFVPLHLILNRPQEHWGPMLAKAEIEARITCNQSLANVAKRVLLPPVLTGPEDVLGYVQPIALANFITDKRIEQDLVIITNHQIKDGTQLAGKVVAIPSADPGYDFLFGMEIGGLVTAFGGPNSHMAIRAAEFGLPAAIGIGQKVFDELTEGARVVLDCKRGQFGVIGMDM